MRLKYIADRRKIVLMPCFVSWQDVKTPTSPFF